MSEKWNFQKIIDRLASHATLWPWLFGGSAMSAIAGWATYATELFSPYAPFSWVAAAFLGGIIFAVIYAAWARSKLWIVDSKVKQDFYKSSDRINPLDSIFRERRINISDLVSPIEPHIRGKTFIDCELIGPANIMLGATAPGKGSMNGVVFYACDACKVKENIIIANGIMFEDCVFIRGRIFRVTLFIPESGYDLTRKAMPGLSWITVE